MLRRPALDLGSLGRGRRSRSQLRNERFASYLATNNRRSINTDRQDAMLVGRKLFRTALTLGLITLAVWVTLESASAIGIF